MTRTVGSERPRRLQQRTFEGVRCLTPVARWMAEQGRAWGWFDSGLNLAGQGDQSILAQCSRGGFRLGPECNRDAARHDTTEQLRQAFDLDRRQFLEDSKPGDFRGGWIGYLAYESQIDFDTALPGRDCHLPYPRLQFLCAVRGVTVSHVDSSTTVWCWDRSEPGWLDVVSRLFEADAVPIQPPINQPYAVNVRPHLHAGLDENTHVVAVRKILRRIGDGEVYQVNYTQPVTVDRPLNPLLTYLRLRDASPSDFGVFLEFPGVCALSTSPELFFSLDAYGQVTARPMKGTRARSSSPETDLALRETLAQSEKDRAENLMIVDLLRNDLGRVAQVGTVRVPSLFDVEGYSTVWQMTSTIEAELRQDADVFSLLQATFPPGSMTGAPKVHATRLIRELEPGPRGLYSGCMGYIGWDQSACFNVVIRTLVCHSDGADWSVGGGVVADSNPKGEHEEALLKLETLLRLE